MSLTAYMAVKHFAVAEDPIPGGYHICVTDPVTQEIVLEIIEASMTIENQKWENDGLLLTAAYSCRTLFLTSGNLAE